MSREKSKEAFVHTVQRFGERLGRRMGLLTVTFKQHVVDAGEAQRRWNSFATHVCPALFDRGWIKAFERQKSGRIHYHVFVDLGFEVDPLAVDWKAYELMKWAQHERRLQDREWWSSRLCASLPGKLPEMWKALRVAGAAYGFGRIELMPVRSVSRTVGEYIAKHYSKQRRQDQDRGVRFWSCGKGVNQEMKASGRWSFVSSPVRRFAAGWRLVYGSDPLEHFGKRKWGKMVCLWGVPDRFAMSSRFAGEVDFSGTDGSGRLVKFGCVFRYVYRRATKDWHLDVSESAKQLWSPETRDGRAETVSEYLSRVASPSSP